MLWLKIAIPVLLAATGAGAMVVAQPADSGQTVSTASGVWIDGPTSVTPIGPGAVTVFAHASASAAIEELELLVDDDVVGADGDLERNEGLVYAQVAWTAEIGMHRLTVRQSGGTGAVSDEVLVTVIEGAAVPTTVTTTTTLLRDASTTVPGSSTTTSTTEPAPGSTTTTAPPVQLTTPATTPPVTTPPTVAPTAPPKPGPVIDAASFVGTPIVYHLPCPAYAVQVSARIRNASSATLTVKGTSFSRVMSQSSSTFSATIPSGFPQAAIGDHTVTVTATGPGGTVSRDVGTLTIKLNCPKD